MSLEKVQLRKLLKLLYLDRSGLIRALREDIRAEAASELGDKSSGGDFFGPFWGDAKKFVANEVDLHQATNERIESNRLRRRLYKLLLEGFLSWWNEKRRWRNEPIALVEKSPSGLFQPEGARLTIRVENILALKGGDGSRRAIYPYFSEKPALSKEAARIGLWILSKTVTDYAIEDIRILDILRSTSFGNADCPLEGNEQEIFTARFNHVKSEWDRLRKEYD